MMARRRRGGGGGKREGFVFGVFEIPAKEGIRDWG